jgi:hypothetical protein
MPWSVVAPDGYPLASNGHRMVFDVVVPRGSRDVQALRRERNPIPFQVLLVGTDWGTRERRTIRLGSVMHTRSALTANWWAMGYYPGYLDPRGIPREVILADNPVESAKGFATRMYAIEHMLHRTGWWPND